MFQNFDHWMVSCNYFHHIMSLEYIINVISNGLAMWGFSRKHSFITHYYSHNVSQEKQSGIILCCFYHWKMVLLPTYCFNKNIDSRVFTYISYAHWCTMSFAFISIYSLISSFPTYFYLIWQCWHAHQQKSHKCLLTIR